MNLIAQNLSAKRGQHLLFHKLNFIVQKGECLLIKGANGAGKSTLLRILAGLFTSFKGALFLQNEQKQKPLFLNYLQQRTCFDRICFI